MNPTKPKDPSDRDGARRRILARQLADQALACVTGGCTTTIRQGADRVWRNDKIEL